MSNTTLKRLLPYQCAPLTSADSLDLDGDGVVTTEELEKQVELVLDKKIETTYVGH